MIRVAQDQIESLSENQEGLYSGRRDSDEGIRSITDWLFIPKRIPVHGHSQLGGCVPEKANRSRRSDRNLRIRACLPRVHAGVSKIEAEL